MKIPFLGSKTKTASPTAMTDTMPLKSGSRNAAAIILQITKAFKDRSRKDIQAWRAALAATEHIDTPRFNRYTDLIDDLKTDGTFKTAVMLRRTSTMSTSFQVRNRKSGDINELASELFQQKWFFDFLNKKIDSIIYGTRVVEFLSFDGHKINFSLIPPRNVVPTEKRVYPDLSKPKPFFQYDAPEHQAWVLELVGDEPLGVINDIIPNLIWKRNVAQSWAEFCEKFGMPLISATTNNNNTTHIDAVEKQLLSLAEASVGVFPEGTTIKFDEANRTDTYNVFSKFIEQNSSEISSVIVGSNTLSKDASNRAQTQVHENSLDFKIAQADRRDISFTVNDQLIPLLKMHGYAFLSDDDVFEWIEAKEELDLNKYWTIVQGVLAEHEVDTDWLSKTFSIPITGKKKSQLMPVASWNKPNYPPSCGHKHHAPVAMANNKIIDRLSAELMQLLWDNGDTLGTASGLVVAEGLELLKGLKEGYGVTVDYDTPDTLALQMMEYNLFEFSESKTEARLAAMSELLIDKEAQQIRSFSDFKRLASQKVSSFNNEWLRTEYNLSVAVGQNSAAFHRFMAEKDTVTSFVEYQTVGDDRVRAAHDVLDGKIFNLRDPEAMKIWPPNGYGCRCEMLQFNRTPLPGQVTIGKDGLNLIKSADPKFEGSQFEINRGDLKKVFTEKQFYKDIKGLPEKLNTMTFDKYGLKPWDSFKSNLNKIKIDPTITPENVKELFKQVEGKVFMGFADYLGRKMMLKKKVFDVHTTGKYIGTQEIRHQLFPHIQDIVSDPDEVWYYEFLESKFKTRYLKFYQDVVVVVDSEVGGEGLEINTWYLMKVDESSLRKGLRIK
ncbi:MAG: DUF935 family protein [Flavobacteriaceae bacterium]|nr:DUF935 family protein [Flavobacteriaceae bacterium]MDZ4147863.1 DUF935 family protein [Flavobacteriaceae bacterium]